MGKLEVPASPKISIILPVYNTVDYLAICIDSVIAQTFTDWELLLIDDGSTDGSDRVCDDYAARDSRIRLVHKSNSGKPDCLNMAIGMARGEYVSFVDSDDWLEPNMLEVLLAALESIGVDFASCGYLNEFVGQTVWAPVCRRKTTLTHSQTVRMIYDRKLYGYLHGRLYRRSLLVEPVPQLRRYEDYAVIYKWAFRGRGTVLCPECLYHYRQRRSSIMNAEGDVRLLTAMIVSECYDFVKSHKVLREEDNKEIAARNFMRIAKTIARQMEGQQCYGMLRKIRQLVASIQPVSHDMVDCKTYRRMGQLKRSVTLFYYSQKFRNLLVLGHRERHYELFD